jgi:transposase
MARTHPWEVSEAWWEKVKVLIPPAPSHAKGGRPRMEDRKAFAENSLAFLHLACAQLIFAKALVFG